MRVAQTARCAAQAVSFGRLICGDDLARRVTSAGAAERLLRLFAERAAGSPVPVPLASVALAHFIGERQFQEAQSLLQCHPQSEAVTQEAATMTPVDGADATPLAVTAGESKATPTVNPLVDFLRSAHSIPTEVLTPLLRRATVAGAGLDTASRAVLWDTMLLRVGQDARSAGRLLGPLCAIATPTDAAVVVDVLQKSVRHGGCYVSTADFAPVLQLLLRNHEAERVLRLWSWMSATAACWDVDAASAVVIAAARLGKLEVVVETIHSLAVAGKDPNIAAQRAFIRFLGLRSPAMPEYAQQLAEYWHPGPRLWRGEACGVGTDLGFALLRSGKRGALRALLVQAAEATNGEEKVRLLREEGFILLVRQVHCNKASDSESDAGAAAAATSFIESAAQMSDLHVQPQVLGTLCLVLDRARIDLLVGHLQQAGGTMTEKDFATVVRLVSEDRDTWKAPSSMLEVLRDVGNCFGHSIPLDTEAWMKLLVEADIAIP